MHLFKSGELTGHSKKSKVLSKEQLVDFNINNYYCIVSENSNIPPHTTDEKDPFPVMSVQLSVCHPHFVELVYQNIIGNPHQKKNQLLMWGHFSILICATPTGCFSHMA